MQDMEHDRQINSPPIITTVRRYCRLIVVVVVVVVVAGVLCGRCVNGTGVSALLNECKECGYENIMITLALGKICLLVR